MLNFHYSSPLIINVMHPIIHMFHPMYILLYITHPNALLKSFPVPNGKIAIGGFQSNDLT